MLHLPTVFEEFFKNALLDKKFQLLHRIYTASIYTENFEGEFPGIEHLTEFIKKEYLTIIPEIFKAAIASERQNNNSNDLKAKKSNTNRMVSKKKRKRNR